MAVGSKAHDQSFNNGFYMRMRKFFKWMSGLLLGLLLLVIVLPYVFRGSIVEQLKRAANEQLDARVDFGRVSLSLIRSFPDLSLSVADLLVINEAPFEGDTLASIRQTRITIDLRSLFGGDGFEIKEIRLRRPDIRLRLLEDGRANWEIVASVDPSPEPSAPAGDFSISLQRVALSDARFTYDDHLYKTYLAVEGLHGTIRGDLTMDGSTLSTRDTRVEAFSLRYDRFPILSEAGVKLRADVEVDMRDWLFTFRENELLINDLPLQFDGLVGLPEGGGTSMDFSFSATRSDFASFLSLIPSIYTTSFEALETEGSLALHGKVDGLLKGEQIPGFAVFLEVVDGMFRYPDLPETVSDVQVNARLINAGNKLDEVELDIPEFRMKLGKNPLEARFAMRTPESDPWIDLFLKGNLDMSDIASFFPLEEGMALAGFIEADLGSRGFLNDLERGAYDRFFAEGRMDVSGLKVAAQPLSHPLYIESLTATLNPRHLTLNTRRIQMGDSEFAVNGTVDNILHHLTEGQLLTGRMDVYAPLLNINQLLQEIPETETADEPMELTVIDVPANIDLSLNTRVDRLLFGSMDIANMEGSVRVVDRVALLESLQMDLPGGRLTLNGAYATTGEQPNVSVGVDFSSFDIQTSFRTFNTVRILAPIANYAAGKVSGNLSLQATLDESLIPVAETMSGSGSLRSSGVEVENNPSLQLMAERTRLDWLSSLSLDDFSLRFSFADGRVETRPFECSFGKSRALVSGVTWFDQRIDYVVQLVVPREQFGSLANQTLDGLITRASEMGLDIRPADHVRLDVKIGGQVTSPEVSVGLPGMLEDEKGRLRGGAERLVQEESERIRARAEEEVSERIDEGRETARERLQEQADGLVSEAEGRAAQMQKEAERAAERIRAEARRQAERLVEEASGAIATAAARRAGEALVREADRRADALEKEAEEQAERMLQEARRQAARLLEETE